MLTPEGLTIPVLTGLAEDFGKQEKGLVGLLDWAYYSAVWSVVTGKNTKFCDYALCRGVRTIYK